MNTDRAEAVLNGFSLVRYRIEPQWHLSLTDDQAWKIAARQRLTDAFGVTIYIANPHISWQRGIVDTLRVGR